MPCFSQSTFEGTKREGGTRDSRANFRFHLHWSLLPLGVALMPRQQFCSTCQKWITGSDKDFERHLKSREHKRANDIRLGRKENAGTADRNKNSAGTKTGRMDGNLRRLMGR